MDNFTALLVPLEDGAEEIQRYRDRHVFMPGRRLPPHVSIFYPFVPAAALTETDVDILVTSAGQCFPFEYVLHRTGSFPEAGVLYLAPDPAEPFLDISRALRKAFPTITPAFPDPVMHLTLAQEDPGASINDLEAEFRRSCSRLLPIRTLARRLDLYEKRNGVWSFVRNCGGDAIPRDRGPTDE